MSSVTSLVASPNDTIAEVIKWSGRGSLPFLFTCWYSNLRSFLRLQNHVRSPFISSVQWINVVFKKWLVVTLWDNLINGKESLRSQWLYHPVPHLPKIGFLLSMSQIENRIELSLFNVSSQEFPHTYINMTTHNKNDEQLMVESGPSVCRALAFSVTLTAQTGKYALK